MRERERERNFGVIRKTRTHGLSAITVVRLDRCSDRREESSKSKQTLPKEIPIFFKTSSLIFSNHLLNLFVPSGYFPRKKKKKKRRKENVSFERSLTIEYKFRIFLRIEKKKRIFLSFRWSYSDRKKRKRAEEKKTN